MDVHSGDLYVLRESIIWMYILGICMCGCRTLTALSTAQTRSTYPF